MILALKVSSQSAVYQPWWALRCSSAPKSFSAGICKAEEGLKRFHKALVAAGLAALAVAGPIAPALALNDDQALVAEAWRTVDHLYYDRTFGGLEWFDLRQKYMKKAQKGFENEKDLFNLIQDMVSQVGDRYTRYLPPAKYDSLVQASVGEVAGVGVQLAFDKTLNLPLITGVEPGAPADDGGVRAGDTLLKVGGEDASGMREDDAAALLRGPEGSRVGVLISRPAGQEKNLDLILTRRKFKIQGVTSRVAEGLGRRLLVVKIKSFSANTAAGVQKSIDEARRVDGVVIDLRGNAGGLLPGGIDTAALFLENGRDIVTVNGRTGSADRRVTSSAGPDATLPVVVVVDRTTASAAEVFSGALRENARAKLVGEKTFGKGVIQTVEPLSRGGLAVTVAKYVTPAGTDINGVGINVDFEEACPPEKDVVQCVPSNAF